jgi:hypothetical protein
LDVDHASFFPLLDKCNDANQKLINIDKNDSPDILKSIQKIPGYLQLVTSLLQIYLLPAIETKNIWA